jgi:hypothetical protein
MEHMAAADADVRVLEEGEIAASGSGASWDAWARRHQPEASDVITVKNPVRRADPEARAEDGTPAREIGDVPGLETVRSGPADGGWD